MTFGRYITAVALALVAGAGVSMAQSEQEQRFLQTLHTEDSLSSKLDEYRSKYHTLSSPDSISIYREYILDTEQKVFDARALKSQLQSQLGDIALTLTQEESTPEPQTQTQTQTQSQSQTIAPEISQSLYQAQQQGKRIELKARGYISNYNTLARLSGEYEQAQTQRSADSIARQFGRIDSLNYNIATQIVGDWQEVGDNKNFAYALLIEQQGITSLFDREQQFQIEEIKMVDSLSSSTHDEPFLNYYASLRWMSEFEALASKELGLVQHSDSLRYIRDSLRMVNFNFAPLQIKERTFIDYEAVKFSTTSIYNASNPIPALKMYERGVIYRLLVGSFKSRQAATLFRGASPIGILRNKEGLLSYYIGGYATLKEAEAARELLLKRGFRRPEIVEFLDGVPHNVTLSPRPVVSKYRVEIDGVSDISSDIRSVIETQGEGRELVKTGATSFVVGVFDNLQGATRLSESLKIIDSTISVSVVEVK